MEYINGRNINGSLNSTSWETSLRKIKTICETIIQCVMVYGEEAWVESRKDRNKLLASEMHCQQSSCRRARQDRIRNETIREMMDRE
jgi:hypothetical protein